MHLRLQPDDIVQICIPAPQDSDADDTVFRGRIASCAGNTLSLDLRDSALPNFNLLPRSAQCILRKSTSLGMLEFDATGHMESVEKTGMVTIALHSPPREVQRREACRIELRLRVRYRNLAATDQPIWKVAELNDVSLGGASLLLKSDELSVGQELLLEFSLDNAFFSVPAILRRIVSHPGSKAVLYGFEYLDLETREQNRLAKAMTQLQLKILSSRVETNPNL